jgi:3-isopropylmalate dehydrogenase
VAAILSAALLLRHLGFESEAAAVERAVASAVRAGETTPDLGGRLDTGAAGAAIRRRVEAEIRGE